MKRSDLPRLPERVQEPVPSGTYVERMSAPAGSRGDPVLDRNLIHFGSRLKRLGLINFFALILMPPPSSITSTWNAIR